MMKRSGHAASINLILGWPRRCQPVWHCPGTFQVPADTILFPHKLLDQVLPFWQGTLKTALVNIKMKSEAQLGNPLEHQNQPCWLPLCDRSTWLRQDSQQGLQPGRTGETCQKHTHIQDLSRHKPTGRDSVLPMHKKHLGECQKSHCSLLKWAKQRKPARYWR